jgi:protein-S-isoprenylcysteine O-methyltransferase Ste14
LLILAHYTMQNNWTAWITIKSDHKLITNGPFEYIRHPMYSSILLYAWGYILMTGNLFVSVAWTILFNMVAFRIPTEEFHLNEKFGEIFKTYCAKTPYKLIPLIF